MPSHTPAEHKKRKTRSPPPFKLMDLVRLMGGQSREAAEDIMKRKKRDKALQRGL